jgi:TonB family protein
LTRLQKDDRLTAAIINPVSDPSFGFLVEVALVESRRELFIWLGDFMRTLHLIAISGLIAGTTALHAQKELGQDEMASHLMTWVTPVYPTIAQAAQVQGDVVFKVELAPDGLVRSMKVVSGPPMLRQATSDALKQWRYQPFHNGNAAIAVTGNVLVRFTLADKPAVHTPHESTANGSWSTTVTFPPPDNRGQPDEKIADLFEPVWNTCSGGVIAHKSNTDVAEACRKAAAIADEFPPDRRYIERRQAYVYAATAFANIRDLQTALPYAVKAVDVVKLGHDGDSGAEAAYSVRGQLRAYSGDLKGGDEDMSVAEKFGRKGSSPGVLKRDLQFHADLLNRLKRPEEAQAKLDEAAKL